MLYIHYIWIGYYLGFPDNSMMNIRSKDGDGAIAKEKQT